MTENEAVFAPILQSERLILNLYEETRDLQTVADLMNSQGSNSPDGSTLIHAAATTKQLLKNTALGPENCAGLRATTPLIYILHLRNENSPSLGLVSLLERHPSIPPDLGFAIFSQYRGQGYGVEAARRFLSYCRDELGIEEIIAMCAPANELSKKLISRLGFVEGGEVLINWRIPACAYVLPGMKNLGKGLVGLNRWGEEK